MPGYKTRKAKTAWLNAVSKDSSAVRDALLGLLETAASGRYPAMHDLHNAIYAYLNPSAGTLDLKQWRISRQLAEHFTSKLSAATKLYPEIYSTYDPEEIARNVVVLAQRYGNFTDYKHSINPVRPKTHPLLIDDFNSAVWQKYDTNCLSFALNCPEKGVIRPGELLRNEDYECKTGWNAKEIKGRLREEDRLTEIFREEAFSGQHHVIAAKYMSPDAIPARMDRSTLPDEMLEIGDFHFYRRAPGSAFWSGKSIKYYPTNLDRYDNLITDPETVDDGYAFAAYYKIPAGGTAFVLPKHPPGRSYDY